MTDIQNGYFDRLMITPVRRLPLLLGLMTADLTLVMALAIPVVVVGLALGVRFHAGVLGIIVFVVLSGIWGLVFTGLPYAIALKTGNPGAVNASFILFFPITFLSTTFVPKPYLQGWLGTVANYNPMTYILQGLRSLIVGGGGVPGPSAKLERGVSRAGRPGHRGVRRHLAVPGPAGVAGARPALLSGSSDVGSGSGVELLEEHGVLAARRHPSVSGDVAEELVGVEVGAEAVDVGLVLAERSHTVVDGRGHVDEMGGRRGARHVDDLDPLPRVTQVREHPAIGGVATGVEGGQTHGPVVGVVDTATVAPGELEVHRHDDLGAQPAQRPGQVATQAPGRARHSRRHGPGTRHG